MAPKALEIGAAYIRVSTDDQTELSDDEDSELLLDSFDGCSLVYPVSADELEADEPSE